MLNENDQQFNEIIRKAKNVSLSEQEKAQIKSNLVTFIKSYSPPIVTAKPTNSWFAWQPAFLSKKLAFQYAAIGLIITGLASYGVSSAAQGALPGDFLYPIKTEVNERVLGLLQVSAKAKADYNIRLVNVRLEEIEAVASRQALDDKKSTAVTNLLNSQIAKAQQKINDIRKEKQEHDSIEAAAELEVSLNGHAQVLDKLQAKQKDARLEAIVLHIKDKARQTKQEKQQHEASVSKNMTTSKAMAEAKLTVIKNRLQEVTQLLENNKTAISQQTYAQATADLALANQSIEAANVKIAANDYTGAFILFQEALSKIQEITLYLSKEISLGIAAVTPPLHANTQTQVQGTVEIQVTPPEEPLPLPMPLPKL